jgi:3'-5' exoribonuclease
MPEKQIFISDLQEGQQVRDLFLISRKNLAETKAGKPYLAMTLMDRTGEIEARAWDNAVMLDAAAEVGDVIVLQARVTSYQNQLQFGVSGFQPAKENQVVLADFMPASKRPAEDMQQELFSLIATVADKGLLELLTHLFSGELLRKFCTAPAAKRMHHAYLGGLIEHTLSVAGMAVRAAEHYPSLDRDMLVAGALVHDIAKTREFSYSSLPFDYTDSGRLIGHLVLGSEMVRSTAAEVKGLAPERVDTLVHLILSHHGRYDFGAPVLPMTPEAILLHHLDDMDAKMNYIDQLRENQEEAGWSDYQRPLERFLYLQPLSEGVGQGTVSQVETGKAKGSTPASRKNKNVKNNLQQRQQTLF